MEPGIVKLEAPKELTPDNVVYWCRHTRELQGSQVKKAQEFVRHDCVKYLGKVPLFDSNHTFVVLPLNTKPEHRVLVDRDEMAFVTLQKIPFHRDYNVSDYLIFKRPDGTFKCNCQAWHTKEARGEITPQGANCSHVLALFFAFKMKMFGKDQGAEPRHTDIDWPEPTNTSTGRY